MSSLSLESPIQTFFRLCHPYLSHYQPDLVDEVADDVGSFDVNRGLFDVALHLVWSVGSYKEERDNFL